MGTIKQILKKIPGLRPLVVWFRNRIRAASAVVRFLRLRQKKRRDSDPVRVGILCQYIPAWNKVKGIYSAMKKDSRFEPLLICLPSNNDPGGLDRPDICENDIYDYYIHNGYEAINGLVGPGQWLDPESLNLDYLFYLRPYDDYLPLVYRSKNVSKHTRICIVMYGMCMTKQVTELAVDPGFFSNVFCYFAEHGDAATINRRITPLAHRLGLCRTVECGVPSFSQIYDEQNSPAPAWNFASEDSFRVMWTPRWTTDPTLGGTNFFLYKDWLLDYAAEHSDTAWLFRPHPLAFEKFVQAGDMTQEQVDQYRKRIAEMANVSLDSEKEYIASFWNSHALITDISGIMPEYFLMDKPLIFCRSNMVLEPTAFTARMLEGCYCVDTPEQLRECLDQLRRGIDPLKNKRSDIINELFGDALNASIPRIMNELVKSL